MMKQSKSLFLAMSLFFFNLSYATEPVCQGSLLANGMTCNSYSAQESDCVSSDDTPLYYVTAYSGYAQCGWSTNGNACIAVAPCSAS